MNIEQMVREASGGMSSDALTGDGVRRFAALVAEECAKVCDIEANGLGQIHGDHEIDAARVCAKNIRDAFRQ